MTILAPGPNTLAANSSPVDAALTKSRPMFVAAFEFSAAMSVLALTTSFYMLQVYDRVLTSRSVDTLILLTVIAVVGISVFGVLDSLRVRLLNRIGLRVADALAPEVLRAMIATASRRRSNGCWTMASPVSRAENPGAHAFDDARSRHQGAARRPGEPA